LPAEEGSEEDNILEELDERSAGGASSRHTGSGTDDDQEDNALESFPKTIATPRRKDSARRAPRAQNPRGFNAAAGRVRHGAASGEEEEEEEEGRERDTVFSEGVLQVLNIDLAAMGVDPDDRAMVEVRQNFHHRKTFRPIIYGHYAHVRASGVLFICCWGVFFLMFFLYTFVNLPNVHFIDPHLHAQKNPRVLKSSKDFWAGFAGPGRRL
jgi:hypothetical protein